MVNSYQERGSRPADMSDSASEPDDKLNGSRGGECEKCTNPHDGKLLMQKEFTLIIDELFTMLFTNCKFNLELREIRNLTNYEQVYQWQEQDDGTKRRQMKYIQDVAGMALGPKEVHVTETQTMNACSKPGVLYSIDSVSDNSNVPYSDYFSVCVHYCLHRVSRSSTLMSVYGHIKPKRSTMFKGFIEKNTMAGLSDFCRILESSLNAEITARTVVPAASRGRGRRRTLALAPQEQASRPIPPHVSSPATPRWLLAILVVLLATNALLFYELYYGTKTVGLRAYDLQHRLISIQSAETTEWLKLLERHATRHRDQLAHWREAVQTTVVRLAQTEQDLLKLLDAIKPSLESAQREAHAYSRSDDV